MISIIALFDIVQALFKLSNIHSMSIKEIIVTTKVAILNKNFFFNPEALFYIVIC